jgi:flagellar hook protein FlgE
MVNSMRASADYAASAKIVQVADDMEKTAIDMIA